MSLRVDDCVARIRERNDALNAVLHVLPEPRSTRALDAPLAGVPYVLKDTWDTAGIPTTGGSYRHRQRIPEVSGRIHAALEAAGAVLLGKSNLCDLSFSSESDNHMRGPVRNPHDPSRTAGGSTGGGAAAVADGMATFDWGTDFGGSIRGPAAFCGVVGLRLSDAVWHVGQEHFPRIPPLLWDFCGMGPLTRAVETARKIVRAVRPALRNGEPDVEMSSSRAVVYAPDRPHLEDWPTFAEDTKRLLRDADVAITIDDELPSPTQVNALYTEYLAAHFGEFVAKGDIALREAIPAVFLGLLSGGRLDKRIHPNTAILLAGIAALGLRHRDRSGPLAVRARLRAAIQRSWSRGALVVTPTCTMLPPRHGRSAFAYRLMSFCKLGNLVDATALALPFGTFATKPGRPPLPRSLQILGPPGSEEAVLDLAARLEEKARGRISPRPS